MIIGPKRAVIITRIRRDRADGDEPEARMFWMNDRQSDIYESISRQLMADGQKRHVVEGLIETVIVEMLTGKMPDEKSAACFHDLRLRFPILSEDDVGNLPVAGCPDGDIEKLVLWATNKDGDKESILFHLTDRQQEGYARHLAAIVAHKNCRSLDYAWALLNQTIGCMLTGLEVRAEEDGQAMVDDLKRLFPKMAHKVFKKLPRASEEEVRRWGFR